MLLTGSLGRLVPDSIMPQITCMLHWTPDSHPKNTNRLIKHWGWNFLFLNGKWSVLHLDPAPRIRMIASFGCTLHLLKPDWSDALWSGPGFKESYRSFKSAPHQIHASQIWKSLANTKPGTHKSAHIMINKGERTFKRVSFGWPYELLVINDQFEAISKV